jgi:hypothetical protein
MVSVITEMSHGSAGSSPTTTLTRDLSQANKPTYCLQLTFQAQVFYRAIQCRHRRRRRRRRRHHHHHHHHHQCHNHKRPKVEVEPLALSV